MEIIIYYLFCLLARKKIIVNALYFIGTVLFVSLSYNTANQLNKVSIQIQLLVARPLENNSQISNGSFHFYETRTQFLSNQCGEKYNSSSTEISNVIRRNRILNHLGFVLRSQSLFYCSVPKVATRTLLTYITYLHIHGDLIPSFTNKSTTGLNSNLNLFNADYLNQMLSSSIKNDSLSLLSLFLSRLLATSNSNSTPLDLWLMYQKTTLPYIRLQTHSNPSVLFSTAFTRMIFVRHPLDRLASAYVDKIASLKAQPFSLYDKLRRDICQKYSSSYLTLDEQKFYRIAGPSHRQIKEPCEQIVPSFEHFIQYIMSSSAQLDVHWQSYSTLCDACRLKYNFIGRYETIQEDLRAIRFKLALNSSEWNVENHFSTGKTKEYYQSLYSKVPYDLICNLKDFYQDDFRLFNYQADDYLTDQQKMLCPQRHYRRFRTLT